MIGKEHTNNTIAERRLNTTHTGVVRRWLMLALLCVTPFLGVLNFQVVTIALPAIQRGLGFAQENLQWVVSANTLTFGGFLIVAGKAADSFGHRRLFIIGLALFIVASLAGGLASSQWILILARALQGLGTAIINPAALALLTDAFPEGPERNRALGLWGAIGPLGGALGVALAGVLVDHLGWPWVFFMNVPVAVLALLLTPLLIAGHRDRVVSRRLDLVGAMTITAGVVLLVYTLTQIVQTNVALLQVMISFIFALLLILAFVLIEVRSQHPLVPLSIFRRRTFTGANLVTLAFAVVANTPIFFFALYMQQIKGYSPFLTGLAFLPTNIAIILGSALGTRLSNRLGYRRTTLLGIGVLLLAPLLLSSISVDGSYLSTLLPGLLMEGLGLGIVQVATMIAGMEGARAEERGLASGLLNMAVQIGTALGLAILVTVATIRTNVLTGLPSVIARVAGFQWAFYAGVAIAVIGLLIAFYTIREQ
jgi:EmrB/QacA subfamily drug resistance transporter